MFRIFMFLSVVVRLFQPRRSIESPQKQKIRDVSGVLAEIIVKHLERRAFSKFHVCCHSHMDLHCADDKLSVLAYYTVMLGLATILLIDGMFLYKPSSA